MKKNNQYWQKRMDDIFLELDKRDVKVFKELSDMYSKHAKEVQDEIFKFYGKYAEEEGITRSQAKIKLRGEDLKDYRANAKKYLESAKNDKELLDRLKQQTKASNISRLEALQLDLEYEIGKLNNELQLTFTMYLSEMAKYAYRTVITGKTLSPHVLEEILKTKWEGYNYSEALWGNTDNLAKELKKVFQKGFIRGSGPRKMAQEIRKAFNVAKYRAETLVRTDGTFVVTNATAKRYQDAGLERYKILVHLDNRTTDICKEIYKEDKIYYFKDYEPGKNAPPLHWNCRSGIIPVYEDLF